MNKVAEILEMPPVKVYEVVLSIQCTERMVIINSDNRIVKR